MRQVLLVLGVWFLVSACATSPQASEPAPPPPPGSTEPRTSVRVLARELELSPQYERSRDRVVLEGDSGCVVLYPGTTVALVNGLRLNGMSKIGRWGDDFSVQTKDATRITAALEADAKRAKPSPPPPPDGKPKKLTPGPGWKVRLQRPWQYIVIHHSATDVGSAASFGRSHRRRGWDGLGYHFVIGNGSGAGDGEVEVGYRWTQQKTGAHAGRPKPSVNLLNEHGIGICLVGNFNNSRPTTRQRQALHRLLDWLRMYCRIPANHVLVHKDCKGTECPGKHFPMQEFLAPHRDVPAAYR